jgi:hypothetical protein
LGFASFVIPDIISANDSGGANPLWVNLLEDAVTLSFAGVPVAIGFAVLKYRLYDIDVLINRTIVYGTLTALLVAVYVGSVVSLQGAVRAMSGQESQLAVVASTLLIAAIFNPLRRRIQACTGRASTAGSMTRERPWRPSPPSSGTRRT